MTSAPELRVPPPGPEPSHVATARCPEREGQPCPPFAVIVPAHDEERTVGGLVREILSRFPCRVVVVDDASRDDTAAEALAAGATVLPLSAQAGAWCAVQAGFRHVLEQGVPLAVTIDADGQHLPETIEPLLAEMHRGRADVVIGACLSRTGPLKRAALAVLRRLGDFGTIDITSGLRVYNERAMRALLSPRAVGLDYQDVGVLLLLREAGLGIGEIAAPMRRRAYGRSHIFHSPSRMLAHVWQNTLLCLRHSRYFSGFRRHGHTAVRGGPGRKVATRLALQRHALLQARQPARREQTATTPGEHPWP